MGQAGEGGWGGIPAGPCRNCSGHGWECCWMASAAGGGGEKVPSVEKWARTDDLAFSRASLYTDLSVVTTIR